MNNQEYEKLVEHIGSYGMLRQNVSFEVAVNFLLEFLNPNDLQIITGASQSMISRVKNGKSSLNMDNLQKIYHFYQEVSAYPVTKEQNVPSDLLPMYNKEDVQDVIDELKDAKYQIDGIIAQAFRKAQKTMRSIRDETPEQKIDLKAHFEKEDLDGNSKNVEEKQNDDKKEKNDFPHKIKIKEVEDIKGNVYLTDNDKDYYLKPEFYDMEKMRKVLGYKGERKEEFYQLTLKERYLLEFNTLIKKAPLQKEEQKVLKNILNPSNFWTLHKNEGGMDNERLRLKYRGRAIIERDTPEYNSIEDVRSWIKYLDEWLQDNPSFKDPNNNHLIELKSK